MRNNLDNALLQRNIQDEYVVVGYYPNDVLNEIIDELRYIADNINNLGDYFNYHKHIKLLGGLDMLYALAGIIHDRDDDLIAFMDAGVSSLDHPCHTMFLKGIRQYKISEQENTDERHWEPLIFQINTEVDAETGDIFLNPRVTSEKEPYGEFNSDDSFEVEIDFVFYWQRMIE